MYAVVEWVDTNPRQVSVVPKSWLDKDSTISYWPPSDVAKSITKKNFERLQLPHWTQHKIRCLRLEGNLVNNCL